MRDILHLKPRERWPPPPPISPEGRIAGLTTSGCVMVSALAWLAVTIRIGLCTENCTIEPGLGGLVLLPVAVALVAAVAVFRAILDRPTDPEASSVWRFGLGVIFAVGVVAAASWIPSMTCPAGTKLSFFQFCAGENGARLPGTSWTLQRRLLDLAGVLVGCTVIRSRRWVKVTAPIAAVVFLGGTGALLLRTLAKN